MNSPETARSADGREPFVLRTIEGRNILFSEQHQALLELDELTARVLRVRDSEAERDELLAGLRDSGLSQDEAQATVQARLDLVSPYTSPRQEAAATAGRAEALELLALEVGGVAVHLHLSAALAHELEPVLARLKSGTTASHAQFVARLDRDKVQLLPPGSGGWTCAREEFVPILKAELIQQALDHGDHRLALHAAALAKGEDLTLLLGSPGAGKSTLAIALNQLGHALVADDVALMDEDGWVTGLAFPFSAKTGSWPLLQHHWPDLLQCPTYRRPDDQEVRFVKVRDWATPRKRKIARIILLDRQDADTQLCPLSPVDALLALVAEGDAPDSRLDRASFQSLADAVTDAECKRLVYRDFFAAAELLADR